MAPLVIDGFVLRFPRTGVVNYVFHVIQELARDPEFELTILLEDMGFSDPEIGQFIGEVRETRFVEKHLRSGVLGRLREYRHTKNLPIRLPTPHEISRTVAPGEIYHATDWYHYPARYADGNILTYHDLTTTLYPEFHEEVNIEKERRKAKAIDGFDHIVAVSYSTRNDLVEHFRVPESKITVSHLGANPIYDTAIYEPRDKFLVRYGLDPSWHYILSVCTIEPRKNIIGMLEAYKTLCLEHPEYRDVRLVLSGHMGWRNETLKQYLAAYPYRENVIFAGFVATSDMPSLYRHASAFVYLSLYEGFGLPILEAMKSSCPVVCSNTSSMPEVLGECGELVPPQKPDAAAAALARILADPCYADSLRFSALMRSKAFSWRKHVADLARIYDAF